MKTAIIVRGHARTWNLVKEHNLRLMSDIYGSADWYFATQYSTTIDRESVRNDFQGFDIKGIVFLDEQDYPLSINKADAKHWRYWMPAYWKIAWLDYHIGLTKRRYELENGIRYDNVVFIRTDCWYFAPSGGETRAVHQLNSMSAAHIGPSLMSDDDWTNDDLVWRTGRSAADLLLMRWLDTHYDRDNDRQLIHGNSHALLGLYCARNLIGYDWHGDSFKYTIIRPDHLDSMPWSWEKHNPNYTDSQHWHLRSLEEKIQWCEKCGIDPCDYQLVD